MTRQKIISLIAVTIAAGVCSDIFGQSRRSSSGQVRTVSIPISIFTKQELRDRQPEEFVQVDRLIVTEDKEEQQILSIRSVTDARLALAILVQEDLTSEFNLQRQDLARFIRNLPRGSRVMIAYLRGGSLQVRQRFTSDLDAAANALRIVTASAIGAPSSPYDGMIDALNRFDALPAGRRAVLLISDGLDVSSGSIDFSPTQSIELDRAILRAQRRSVSVYSFYWPATLTQGGSRASLAGQSSLLRISEETGGRAFFSGNRAPVSLQPFFRELSILLNRQFLLTYLSTHMNRGYHRVDVRSTNSEVKIEHPKGYYYR
ncbi:MAG: hypothetical protein LC734_02225 [Acidobacteria bacterium]|nr:hypothetical protein [Acidobacteriota bacterium]